jgi:RNA polymerase sigma factor (sigma-70 family)
MKSYNLENYVRYKEDLKKKTNSIERKNFNEYSRDELICLFLPLVENISRKFSTAQQASGVMDITDIIQEGSVALIYAIDSMDINKIMNSYDPEKTIKSFLSKRIKGSIRRAIDTNRGSIRIPEYKIQEIRKSVGDGKMLEMFFNSIFLSIDDRINDDDEYGENIFYEIRDESKQYNIDMINSFLFNSMAKYLGINSKEFEVLRLSYGLDCDKHSALQIAKILNIDGPSAYVRVSEIKKQAIKKLTASMNYPQVIDFL